MFTKSENTAAGMEKSRHNILVTDKAVENMTSCLMILQDKISTSRNQISDVGQDSRC